MRLYENNYEILIAWMCFNQYSACQNISGASNMTVIGDITPTVFYENGKFRWH